VGIDRTAPAKGTGLGTRLVRALAVQIGGRFTIGPAAGGGTQCIVTWPVLHGQGQRAD
jgi:two-component sensor histidine kinase